MKSLYQLVKSLNRREINLVRKFFSSSESVYSESPRSLRLFEILLEAKTLPDQKQLCLQLYENSSPDALYKLSSRLNAQLLEIVSSSINNEKYKLDQADKASLKVRRKIHHFYQLYLVKGNSPVLQHLLDETISLATKYEVYGSLIEALQFKKYFTGFVKGYQEFTSYQKKIEFYSYCYHGLIKAADYYYSLIIGNNVQGNPNQNKIKIKLKSAIKELEKDLEKTSSANIHYYLLQLQLALYINGEEYEKAKEICLSLIDLINSNAAVFKNNRLAFAFDNIAQCELYLRNYSSCVLYARKAQENIPEQNINYLVSKEIELHAYFYNKEFPNAKKILNLLLKKNSSRIGEIRVSKYKFITANIHFYEGKYGQVTEILNENSEIAKDKPGWEMSIRILKIMCFIEQAKTEQASDQIIHLRRFISRHSSKSISKRFRLISEVLKTLELNEYNFKNEKMRSYFKILSSENPQYKWTTFSSELIPFHEWLEKKMS